MIYITGDTHGDFQRIFDFCMRFETSVDDVMVFLGMQASISVEALRIR